MVPSKERTTFESDPIVEELLKKDPEEWNAKQRRMIKRYQERNLEIVKGNSDIGNESSVASSSSNQVAETKEEDDVTKSNYNDTQEASEENMNETKNEQNLKRSQEDTNESVVVTTNTMNNKSAGGDANTEIVSPEDEVYKLLEQLNSKMKRTLSRRLEREGISALNDVKIEATKILGNDSQQQPKDNQKKRDSAALTTEENRQAEVQSSKKKRKKESNDWTALPPEERLRREEQRRLQQEAAERRARGDAKTPGFKHPLNSERRRANRRKSKWKSKPSSSSGTKVVKNEHNHSGFLHRKQSG